MIKRTLALIIALAILIPSYSIPAAARLPDYLSEAVQLEAENAAAAAMAYEKSYKFTSGMSESDFNLMVSVLYNDHPELFHLSLAYNYSYRKDPVTGERIITAINFRYTMTKEEAEAARAEVERWIEGVFSLADPDFGDFEYALFFHDYIAANFEYDYSLSSRNIYSMIKTGRAVCQGYALLYAALLKRAGVGVTWANSSEMNHMWNLVNIDGEWYHADVTWDDQKSRGIGSASHQYFLLSDAAVSSESAGHYGWMSPHACTSVRFDTAPFRSVSSPFAYISGRWYYISGRSLYSTDSALSTGSEVRPLGYSWPVWNSTGKIYSLAYTGVISHGGKLYMNSPTSIVCFDPADGSFSDIYTYPESDGYIYGFRIDYGPDGVSGAGLGTGCVYIKISTAPGETGAEKRIRLFWPKDAVKGDSDGDGEFALSDVVLILRYVAGWDVTVDEYLADLNGDGEIESGDVVLALRSLAGWN